MKQTFYNPFDKLLKDSLRVLEERQKKEWSNETEQAKPEKVTAAPIEAEPKTPTPPRGVPNTEGFACSICGGIPERLRTDGISASRHLPAKKSAKKYRDTEFCDGQGRPTIKPT